MSHTTKYKVAITDKECAVAALKRMGWTDSRVEIHDEAQELLDYAGRRMGLFANVIVRCKNLSGDVNDFGIAVGEEDGEVFADGKQIDQERLVQFYGAEKALKEANARGYFTAEEVLDDGTIRLRLRR